MRRSICFCEPNRALAGEVNTWRFHYTTGIKLPKGTLLRFDLQSDGRAIDWEIPTTDLKKKKNVIFAETESGKTMQAKEVDLPDCYTPVFDFTLPEEVESGDTITITVGSAQKKPESFVKFGTQAQTYAQRRRTFRLHIDTSGKKRFDDPEVFSLDIRGNVLHSIKVLTPSFAIKNKRFDVTVRFEDEFGNLTSNAPEDTLIELSHEHLRENLSWKLFVPETGFITLPNLYFNEVGVYTIQLKNCKTGELFKSPPIKCFADNPQNVYWGLLHGESERHDSMENIENCLRHFRDDRSLHFYSASPFESLDETPNDIWKLITQNVAEFDEAERFCSFLGFQWDGSAGSEGVRQFIWLKDNKPLLRKKDGKFNTLKKIYKSQSPKELMSIPCFTMGKGLEFNFKDFNPEFERVVEIYNSWGSSEFTKKEGNPRPIEKTGKKGVSETPDGSILKALLANNRFGFVAGGLDDRGVYADFFDDGQEQYTPGLTAIISPEQSRTALWEALYNRSCYATTGARIILGISLAGTPMGGETNTLDKHGLNVNRHLSGFVAGTNPLKSVEIIRNGKVIHSWEPEEYSFDFAFDDLSPLKDVALQAKDKNPPFVFYYLRVIQEDGHIAWSSPIWVDYIPGKPVAKKGKPAGKASNSAPKKEKIVIPEEADEEDEEEEEEDLE